MNQLYIVVALVAAFANAEDEPFSIGLGVLSPSYSQTVGKENVKVDFKQGDDGFSYSVGDPKSGSKTYLNFGASAARNPAASPAGYGGVNPSGYESANPSGYAGVNPSGYGNANPSGYGNANPSGYAGVNPSGYASVNPSGYGSVGPSGYASANPSGYANANPAGYASPAGPSPYSYSGPSSGYDQPSAGAYGQAAGSYGFYNGPSPVAPQSYVGGESARKPEGPMEIIPAGFSYHGTDGQSFLKNNDEESSLFMVSEGDQESRGGPAQKSFESGLGGKGQKRYLPNGLVGYGPGGPKRSSGGSLGVGEYAGPQYGGVFREHGGHE